MVRITGEKRKNPREHRPPENILFDYAPEKSGDALKNFVSQRLYNLGIEKIDSDFVTKEKEVATYYDKKLNLYIESHAVDEILEHCAVMANKGLEALGFLAGDLYRWNGEDFSVIHDIVTGKLNSTPVSVKFKKDAFENLFDQLDEIGYDYILIGWYHSHPGYTSFMSPVDMDTQSRMFNKPFHVALVADPINMELKAFRIVDERCIEIPYAVFEDNDSI
ncbi:MAG: hypothetical protein U9O96_03665 [Candidatus Thermoplasmatota archaeon]|nr:hypothetical protein [Candidatus Thermoplasmatota archaeon]